MLGRETGIVRWRYDHRGRDSAEMGGELLVRGVIGPRELL